MNETNETTKCPECYGTGQLPIMQPPDQTYRRKLAPVFCRKCDGTGQIMPPAFKAN